jgi:hypothetical protein
MNFYWIYDLPNWQFFIICITVFIGFSLLGTFFFSRILKTKLSLTVEHNSIVSTFLATSGVFYGITLGLIAVGTFENFNSVESIVNNESSSLAGLYRDVQILEGPDKEKMLKTLKNYTTYVVDTAWPLQSRGIIPKQGTGIINSFQKELSLYEPVNDKDKIIFAELFKQYNILIEDRRLRLNAVNASLPSAIWVILFLGAFVNIALIWCLVINNKKLEILMNILSGLLLGSLIFLIASMDNPFRGNFSVSSQSFQAILDELMK